MRRLGRVTCLALAGMILLGLSGISCAPEVMTVADTDLVITVKSPQANYPALRTYALPSSITDLCTIDLPAAGLGGAGGGSAGGAGSLDDCSPLPVRFDDVVLEAIADNLETRGFSRVTPAQSPDVIVTVGAVVRQDWYYVPGYPWCDPFYDYYCWFPPTGYAYSFSTGSILINMIDGTSTSKKVKSVWFAGLRGLYERSSQKGGEQRIVDMVDRAFSQSPYLGPGVQP